MTGGLIQIATYGNKDLFLTGNPEITFFKTIYKRYTNFSIESKKIPFNTNINFGQLCTVTIPKNADLVHKMHLEITLPEININNYNTTIINNTNLNISKNNYNIIKNFMIVNIESYRNAYKEYLPGNIVSSEELINEIKSTFNNTNFNKAIDTELYSSSTDELLNMLTNYYNGDGTIAYNKLINISMLSIIDKYSDTNNKYEVMNSLNIALNESISLEKHFFDIYLQEKKNYEIDSKNNIKFAWVNNIGTSLIDYVEIDIGGKIIDRHYGTWLNIWHELTESEYKNDIYNKMIGNITELTSFDKNTKPSYTLLVPLHFWFNKHNGLAFPLVSLQYQDMSLNIKFRKLSECSYIDEKSIIKINNSITNFTLDDLVYENKLKLECSISIDYIYIDSNERKLFSRSNHEYLIEQIQYEIFNDINTSNISIKLTFLHSCKEFIWVIQKNKYITNLNDNTKLQWDNYSLNDNYTGNPFINSKLSFNGYDRTINMDGKYSNYLQPLIYHSKRPKDGINLYSFCLTPENYQPSGYCNTSRLTDVSMHFNINKDIFNDNNEATLKIFAVNYNILRIKNGICDTIFN